MIAVISISAASVIFMITLVLFKPSVKIKKYSLSLFWIPPFAGAVVLVASGLLGFEEAFAGLAADTAVNPLKILALFLAMAIMSIFLDETGFFRYLALEVFSRVGSSQKKVFNELFALVSILTVFTSNDIIILTFTPFIVYFCKNAEIDPVPYLVAEFAAANTWSIMLIIGNPTNIYLATAYGIGFVEYIAVMVLPAFLAGVSAYASVRLIFRKKLAVPLGRGVGLQKTEIKDKFALVTGFAALFGCTAVLTVSSYVDIEMWLVSVAFAAAMFLTLGIYRLARREKPVYLMHTVARAPKEIIPFVISMFVLVLGLQKYGVTEKIAALLPSGKFAVLSYGISSFLASNVVNNIPMSVLFSAVTSSLSGAEGLAAVYASVIGSNVGAILTPIGALAGIMWMQILGAHGLKFSYGEFIKYGLAVAVPALLFSLGGLYLSLAFL